MYAYFQQPYPHRHESLRQRSLIAAAVGVFVGLFLNFFQPFGAYLWQDPAKPYILGGYGVVTFICLMLVNMIVPTLFKQWYAEERWTVAKEIGWTLLIIVLIALGNMIYGKIIFGWSFRLSDALLWLGITGAIGIMPATVITMLNYVQLARRYETKQLHIPSNKIAAEAVVVTLVADNEKDTLTVKLSDLLFIESADNYSEVVFLKEKKVQKALLRGSLSRMEEQLTHPVVRCHRSYIVNLQQVERIFGNAQGYKLQLNDWPEPIPVARRFSDMVKNYFMAS
ncbi:LytTR family DNA-binding domain-containing protein [Haliscomenobacter sp.]|uniref:LytR/AlgR family response regulator transcription factor n=1 Tax=Haliscomenobacter sp. TaxID=2717303 RepID=UPI003364E444